jgi:rubredoxin
VPFENAALTFGAFITLDFSQLVPDPQTHRSPTHCAVGTIEYPPIAGQRTPPGSLVYIKSSLTGDEPSDVLEHAGIHPQFPHDSTADQWFNESQFESYRQLGYHIGSKVFELSKRNLKSYRPAGGSRRKQRKSWTLFEELRDRWHAPSAAVEKSFARHGEAFEQLLQELRTSSKLSGLTKEFYSKIPLGTVEEKFLYCNSIFQLMENVYIDLNLEDEFNHPDNEGWNEMFKSWWAAPEMKNTWAISKKTFGQRFQQWCEREL